MSTPKPRPFSHLLEIDKSLEKLICKQIAEYSGQGTTLESAIGAMVLAQHYGTSTLRMMHSPATFRKYEKILGIEFDLHFEKKTKLSGKSAGVRAAEAIGAFWDVVMGRKKPVDNKGWISRSTMGGSDA